MDGNFDAKNSHSHAPLQRGCSSGPARNPGPARIRHGIVCACACQPRSLGESGNDQVYASTPACQRASARARRRAYKIQTFLIRQIHNVAGVLSGRRAACRRSSRSLARL